MEPTPKLEARRWHVFGALLVLTLLSPARAHFISGVEDDFPLSYYPMFTNRRGETTQVEHLTGRLADGTEVMLPGRCFGPGGMNTVRKQLRRSAREGRSDAVLRNVRERLPGCVQMEGELDQVAFVSSVYPLEEATRPQPAPIQRKTLAVLPLEGAIP